MVIIRLLKYRDEYICKPPGVTFRSSLGKQNLHLNGKKSICFLSSEKWWSRPKELSPYFFTTCFWQNIWNTILQVFYHSCFSPVTRLLTTSYQLLIKYFNLLMRNKKFDRYPLTYRKLLIRYFTLKENDTSGNI